MDEKKRDGGGGQRSITKVEGGEKEGGDERVERVIAGNAVGKVKEAAEEEGGNEEEEEEEEGGVEGFREEEEAEAEASEEDAPPTTSPLTPPPPLNSPRFVSPSSLLSLYCFFSSHLGISSPSTIASLLATYPQLLRSNPTNDFLPRVRGVAATAATATAATATDFASLPLVDLQQLFLWVAVSQAVAEELLFRGLLLTALQGRLGR
ncbi:unnamed protein product [Closterium sp. NIES-53]